MFFSDEEEYSRPSEISDLPETPPFYCPVCGEKVYRYYANLEGVIVGCDNCVSGYNPYPRSKNRIRRSCGG